MLSMWKRVLTLLVVAIGLAFVGLPVETLAKEKKENQARKGRLALLMWLFRQNNN